MIKLKVCGMRDRGNIEAVATLAPDYMGFIFFPGSPRYAGANFSIAPDFPDAVERVGVFVNESTSTMLLHAERFGLHYLQLHGHESIQQVADLKAAGVGLIKVFSVDDQFDFNQTHPYKPYVDFFLFDTKGKFYGGNARAFNWDILNRYDQDVPFFLSGGLSPENVEGVNMLKGMNLHALDVNSGVEDSPGLKNKTKVMEIKKILSSIL